MARLLSEKDESGIRLMTLETTEGELLTYALVLQHLLENSTPAAVEGITGAYMDEVEGFLGDLIDLIDPDEWEAIGELRARIPA